MANQIIEFTRNSRAQCQLLQEAQTQGGMVPALKPLAGQPFPSLFSGILPL